MELLEAGSRIPRYGGKSWDNLQRSILAYGFVKCGSSRFRSPVEGM